VALSGGRVAASLFALQAGASEFLVGLLIGLYSLLPMIFSLAMGRRIDRSGPFRPMRLGIAAITVGAALPVLVPHIAALFVTAALCGSGFMMVGISAQHSVGHLSADGPPRRVAHFGWLALGLSTSGILGPIVVGVVIDGAGYRAAFAVLAASAAASLVLLLKHRAALSALHAAPVQAEQGHIWGLVGTPAMRRIYLVGVLLSISWDLFTFLMPILGHRRALSASTIGAILAAFAVGTFSVRLLMARLAHAFSEWQILRAAIVVIVCVYVALPLIESVTIFFPLAFLLGTAVGCGQPNMLSLLSAMAPRGRGAEAVAVRTMLGNGSSVVVPLLFGATAASLGLAPVFWGVAVLIAMALPAAHGASNE